MSVRGINTCVVTGRIAGDSDACGDCDPCIYGKDKVPDAVKRLLAEKDDWRAKYESECAARDERDSREREMEQLDHDGQL